MGKIKKYFKKKLYLYGIWGKGNALKRLEWLEATLKKIPEGSRILDAGAGELVQKRFCEHLNYVSQDFAEYDGTGNNKGLQTKTRDNTKLDIISDITSIPEPDNSFDAIMCIEVFEHIPDPISAIKEFSRLLKPGGYLILTAPFVSGTHFAPYHFYTGFNRYFYEKHLPDNGFKITELSQNGNYFYFIKEELRRILGEFDTILKASNMRTKGRLNLFNKITIILLIRKLTKLSDRATEQDDFFTTGFHVVARKQ
ncbi:MAG: class I SAM-dependent methyltransferase [Bacteroidales bacterium]|nr:class I SAM-dependent methyltransferase [Bacteroidales bacterium]